MDNFLKSINITILLNPINSYLIFHFVLFNTQLRLNLNLKWKYKFIEYWSKSCKYLLNLQMDKLTLSGLIALLSVQQQMNNNGIQRGLISNQQDGQELVFSLIRTNFMNNTDAIFCGCTGDKERYNRILEIVNDVHLSRSILTPVRIASCEKTKRIMILQQKVEILSEEEAISHNQQEYDNLIKQELQFVSKQRYCIQDGRLVFVDIEFSHEHSEDTPEDHISVSITDQHNQEDQESVLDTDMEISINAGFLW